MSAGNSQAKDIAERGGQPLSRFNGLDEYYSRVGALPATPLHSTTCTHRGKIPSEL